MPRRTWSSSLARHSRIQATGGAYKTTQSESEGGEDLLPVGTRLPRTTRAPEAGLAVRLIPRKTSEYLIEIANNGDMDLENISWQCRTMSRTGQSWRRFFLNIPLRIWPRGNISVYPHSSLRRTGYDRASRNCDNA